MMKSLKRRMIASYTATTGVILTLVVMLTLFMSFWKNSQNRLELFYGNFTSFNNQIQNSNKISDLWISKEENENQLILSIEENGQPLQLLHAPEEEKYRQKQLQKLKELALKDHIDTRIAPVSVDELQSEIFQWKDQGNLYYGKLCVYRQESGYRSIFFIKRFENLTAENIKRVIFFILIDTIGILLLYAASVLFVRRAVKPVEEGRRKQNEFIAAASHELRSPMAVIKANLSLIKANFSVVKEDEETEKTVDIQNAVNAMENEEFIDTQNAVNVMENELNRMAKLVEELLLLASTDAGTWKMNFTSVEMENLLIEVYESYLPICMEKGLNLKIEFGDEELGRVHGDKERMKQIIMILLDNAARYSKAGKEIVICGKMLGSKRKAIQIEIIDHGKGISKEEAEHIFERFYQADRARSEKNNFGLGLSIAKELCEIQKGKISYQDTEGGGATFILKFPTEIRI